VKEWEAFLHHAVGSRDAHPQAERRNIREYLYALATDVILGHNLDESVQLRLLGELVNAQPLNHEGGPSDNRIGKFLTEHPVAEYVDLDQVKKATCYASKIEDEDLREHIEDEVLGVLHRAEKSAHNDMISAHNDMINDARYHYWLGTANNAYNQALSRYNQALGTINGLFEFDHSRLLYPDCRWVK
jgi:hypothetical protein